MDISEVHAHGLHRQWHFRLYPSAEDCAQRCMFVEGHCSKGGDGIQLRHVRQSLASRKVLLDDFAEGIVFRCGIAIFAERGVIVVARRLGFVAVTVVGTVGIFEVRPAVEHVHAHRDVVPKHPVELFGRAVPVAFGMPFAPYVEPCGIEFSHKVWTSFAELVNGVHDVLTHGTVYGGECAVHISCRHLSGTVAGDEGNVESGLAYHLAQLSKVHLVGGIRPIFIFHLYHQDGAPVGDGECGKLLAEAVDVAFAGVEELWVVAAPNHVFVFLYPIGIPAEVPLGAYIGSGTEYDVHALFAAGADEAC